MFNYCVKGHFLTREGGHGAPPRENHFQARTVAPKPPPQKLPTLPAAPSGPAIKPIALRMVYDAAHAVRIPVIGMGGISTAADVVEFMLAGPTAGKIGTASHWEACATEKIVGGLQALCAAHEDGPLAALN